MMFNKKIIIKKFKKEFLPSGKKLKIKILKIIN